MTRIATTVIAGAFVFALGASAQSPDRKETEPAEQELVKLENEWMALAFKHDEASIEKLSRMYGDEFLMTFDGVVYSKQQMLEFVRSRKEELVSFVLDEWQVRLYGGVAVVMGRAASKTRLAGKEESAQSRFTDTWVRRDGRWQCVAAHNSTITQR